MFSLRKIALLGVIGLTAFTMSCSDDSEDENGGGVTPPPLPSGFDQSGAVTIGGGTGSSVGSFLDLDTWTDGKPTIYTQGQAAAAVSSIDLIFDGTNLKTPIGCKNGAAGSFCQAEMAGASSNGAAIWDATNKTINSAADVVTTWLNFDADDYGDNVIALAAGGKYIVYTSGEGLALVTVGDVKTDAEFNIGYIAD